MAATVLLKAKGLNLSSNNLTHSEGTLTATNNVIIKRDNVIESRRGFRLYGSQIGSSSDTAKQLFVYQDRILRHYSNVLEYDTGTTDTSGTAIFQPFAGTYTEPTTGFRIRNVVSNSNLYFTTNDGVKKITAKSASDFSQLPVSTTGTAASGSNSLTSMATTAGIASGYIITGTGIPVNTTVTSTTSTTVTMSQNATANGSAITLTFSPNLIANAGGVKAINISSGYAKFIQSQETGFLSEDSVVAYRVVWGSKDANGNLILGTPSERLIVSNPLLSALTLDFNRLLAKLDDLNQTGSLINNGNYTFSTAASTVVTATASTTSGSPSITVVSATGLTLGQAVSASAVFPSGATIQYISGTTIVLNQNATATNASTAVTFTTPTNLSLTSASSITSLRTNIIRLATKLDQDIQLANSVGTGVPLTMVSGAAVSSSSTRICTLSFSAGTASNYISAGDTIYLQGFTIPTGTINGAQTVLSVTTGSLTFSPTDTTANGNSTVAGTVESYNYRHITQPPVITSSGTHGDFLNIQAYWQAIIARLLVETTSTISSALLTANISPLVPTTGATVILNFNIPRDIIFNYHFYQVYRSRVFSATSDTDILNDITPDDELALVYEGFPTQTQYNSKTVSVEDVVPDALAGAFLYTDENNGDGSDQANDIPPLCRDINRFKNYIFYANTKTKYRATVNLLGVSNLSSSSKLTISDGTTTNTYGFASAVAQARTITCGTYANLTAAGYFDLSLPNDRKLYYVWFDKTGSDTDPAVSGRLGIRVNLNENIPGSTTAISAGTASDIANKLNQTLLGYPLSITSTVSGAVVTITNIDTGRVTSSDVTTNVGFGTGWSAAITVAGAGENTSTKTAAISSAVSSAQAIDDTARSIVNVINSNNSDIVYAYYITGTQLVAGTIVLEVKTLSTSLFYVMANNTSTGQSFVPDLSPSITTISNTVANPTVVTATSHGLSNLDQVVISGSNSTPSIDGVYTITYLTANTFSIPVNVTVLGSAGGIRSANSAVSADNEQKVNRIYYSKLSQPDAVPILNYLDIGAENKAILRIAPLRDTLFIFKEDGVFRLSGEIAPFTVSLFDSSYVLVAPDTLSVANNVLYGYTTQGIQTMSEAGPSIVSRDIDVAVLKLNTTLYPNFKTASWGTGYDSDNAYYFFTVSEFDDAVATICYRFSNLTNSWTTLDKSNTCGIVNSVDDKLYLGAGDTNYLEQERKNFDRSDYADREISTTLTAGNYLQSGLVIQLASVSGIEPGDILYQDQTLSIFEYNSLLSKLDVDPGPLDTNYHSALAAVAGDDMRAKLTALAAKLDADSHTVTKTYTTTVQSISLSVSAANQSIANPTVITSVAHGLVNGRVVTVSGNNATPDCDGVYIITRITADTFSIPVNVLAQGSTTFTVQTVDSDFRDIEACYNAIIDLLNSDAGVASNNYRALYESNPIEAVIESVNTATKQLTVNVALNFIQGALTIYKAIDCSFQYSPIHMGDPLGLKHLREATVMFEAMNFTAATLGFSTDLLPGVTTVDITGQGNGLYGMGDFGTGFYGGAGNSAPFRTYIPRNAQRCRYLLVSFAHRVGREIFSIFGMTVTGSAGQSSRAYR